MANTRPLSEYLYVSAKEIISHPAEESVIHVDQLVLARSFAMAVLKFHSTPWLREYVSIQELSFSHFNDGDLSSCIRTAHLGFDFVQTSVLEGFPTPAKDMGDSAAIEEAKLTHGIRNLTLWSLGTIMYVLPEQYILALFNLTSKMTPHSASGGARARTLASHWGAARAKLFS